MIPAIPAPNQPRDLGERINVTCSVGECSCKAELFEHDRGIFAYCKIHAVGARLPTSEQPPNEN